MREFLIRKEVERMIQNPLDWLGAESASAELAELVGRQMLHTHLSMLDHGLVASMGVMLLCC